VQDPNHLKEEVREFWNRQSCDTQVARSEKFSRSYFEEIEAFRYFDQPYIHSFAQFTRYHGKKVLEVGFGAGTDFLQWVRAGADVTGIDLTQEALDNLTNRIRQYHLTCPKTLKIGDAEKLPFDDNTFDLGYSFGVLHHSPDTEKAIKELVRVVRPGGEIKIMVYNRRSIWALNQWVKHALLRGRPWKTFAWVLWRYNESLGTKSYTRQELAQLFLALPLEEIHIRTEITAADYLSSSAFPPLNWMYRLAIGCAGWTFPWRPEHYVQRADDPDIKRDYGSESYLPPKVSFAGNCLGFFHCISARKKTQP